LIREAQVWHKSLQDNHLQSFLVFDRPPGGDEAHLSRCAGTAGKMALLADYTSCRAQPGGGPGSEPAGGLRSRATARTHLAVAIDASFAWPEGRALDCGGRDAALATRPASAGRPAG